MKANFKTLTSTLVLVSSASVLAATDAITPGTYRNKDCRVKVEETRMPGFLMITINQENAKGGSNWVILNLDTQKADNFSLCDGGDYNYPIDFEKQQVGSLTAYTITCGGRLKAVSTRMTITVDSASHELVGTSFFNKVAAFSLPGAYLPGVQEVTDDLNCPGLSR